MSDLYVDMREAGEQLYYRAIAADATDPHDSELEVKVFGLKLEGGIGNAMGRSALRRRLGLAREAWPECHWEPTAAKKAGSK